MSTGRTYRLGNQQTVTQFLFRGHCPNIGREHVSNHVAFNLNLETAEVQLLIFFDLCRLSSPGSSTVPCRDTVPCHVVRTAVPSASC